MRLFIAMDVPPDEVFMQLYRELIGLSGPLKPVDPVNLHLSLKFLGAPKTTVNSVIEAVKEVGAHHKPFDIRPIGSGAFPSWRDPSVLWFGLSEAQRLKAIAEEIDLSLHRSIGSELERRKFKPHLTIARCRKRGTLNIDLVRSLMDSALDELDSRGYLIEFHDLHLYNSTLTPEGPKYRKLASFPLARVEE